MVNVNVWFIPRSRSTVLTKCLSNIPGTKVYHEYFQAALIIEECRAELEAQNLPIDPQCTIDNLMKKFNNDKSKFRLVKETPLGISKEILTELITEDSVNVFLLRDPALVATSWLSKSNKIKYDILADFPNFTLEAFYQRMLEALIYAREKCSKAPLIVTG